MARFEAMARFQNPFKIGHFGGLNEESKVPLRRGGSPAEKG